MRLNITSVDCKMVVQLHELMGVGSVLPKDYRPKYRIPFDVGNGITKKLLYGYKLHLHHALLSCLKFCLGRTLVGISGGWPGTSVYLCKQYMPTSCAIPYTIHCTMLVYYSYAIASLARSLGVIAHAYRARVELKVCAKVTCTSYTGSS